MSRRIGVPAADELFRPTVVPSGQPGREQPEETEPTERTEPPEDDRAATLPPLRTPSGRVRHDEKMTVYVTSDELFDLEHARLSLRRHQGLAVDRGRLVREAVAIAIEDFEENGATSLIAQRLMRP